MSPESITFVDQHDSQYLKVGRPSDVWSLGCILYQMIYGAPPFAHISPPIKRLACIVQESFVISYPVYPSDPQAIACIKGCLLRNPKQRLTISELLEHEFSKQKTQSSVVGKCIPSQEKLFDILRESLKTLRLNVNEERLRTIAQVVIYSL